jgi:hypothetical protein
VKIRTLRFAAASLVVATALAHGVRAEPPPERRAPGARDERARVVLIGEAGKSEDLKSVLSELLERRGIAVEYEERPRFSSKALLAESTDARVWVFVSQPGPHVAKLYFRGPAGERFLLRQLALKNGLDEIGRELIGQVVETSTVALLRSNAGVSREEARAGMSEEEATEAPGDSEPLIEPAKPEAASTNETAGRRGRFEWDLDARGSLKWSGRDLGFDHALGLEAAFGARLGRSGFVRGRVTFEYGFGQSIEAEGVEATVRATGLRAGVDVGTKTGINAFSIGALGGADFRTISPVASTSPSLQLEATSRSAVPVLRLEARYELSVGAFRATAGLFADASLSDTSYDVRDAGGEHAVAAPWRVSPGAAITIGVRKNW